MKSVSKTETNRALNDLVELGILERKGDRFTYSKGFQNTTYKNNTDSAIRCLYDYGYFKKPRTEREILIIVTMLLMPAEKKKKKAK